MTTDTKESARLDALAGFDMLDTPREQDFDEIADIASRICETPIAVVNLIGDGRQFFKAEVGLGVRETPLDSSFCAKAILEEEFLVVPDATKDPRFDCNPLVTAQNGLRFYAGALLKTAEGHAIGTVCVLDFRPRDLTANQKDLLKILAHQVMRQLELRKALREHNEMVALQIASDQRILDSKAELDTTAERWRNVFERLSEAFQVGRVIRDDIGRIVDFRLMELNKAWGDLIGFDPKAAIGRTVREVFPDIEEHWIEIFGRVVETGQSMTFTRQFGEHNNWYEGRAFPLDDDQFGVLFIDVTERVQADRRRVALTLIADKLRELRTITEMTATVSGIVGEALDLSRAGFGRLVDGDAVEIEPDWTSPGVSSISGRHRFADYGDLLDDLLKGETIVIDDVVTDPRTKADPAPMRNAGIGSLVNVPVTDRGKTVAVLIAHGVVARHWTAHDLAFLRNVADRLEAAVARLQAEADQRVLNDELSHRMKNIFAMVQAIASQTLRGIEDQRPVEAFTQRIQALSSAHEVLLQENRSAAKLLWVAQAVVQTLSTLDRFEIDGANIELGPRATLSVSLLLHELTTNALKYGSLSVPEGKVALSWAVDSAGAEPMLRMTWQELGGPPVSEPVKRSFGSRLIRLGLVGKGGAAKHYRPAGLFAEFEATMDDIGSL